MIGQTISHYKILEKLGEGGGVVLEEAAILSAQLVGKTKTKVGMNYPGLDNRQLAPNIVHWLSKLLT